MTSRNAIIMSGMDVPVATVPDTLHVGFRQLWIEAQNGAGVTATLFSGSGLGSPFLTLAIEREGRPTIYETIDVTDFLEQWITEAVERADG